MTAAVRHRAVDSQVDSSHVEWCGSNADRGGECSSLAGEPVSKNGDTPASISDGELCPVGRFACSLHIFQVFPLATLRLLFQAFQPFFFLVGSR